MTTSKLKGYLIFLLCIYFGKAISQPQILDQVAAIVGSKIILQSEVEQQYQVYLSQGNYAKPEIKCSILEKMIVNKLLLHHAIIDSIEVTDQQVEDGMERRFRYYIEQFGSVEKFEEFYGKSVLDWREELRPIFRENLLTQAMQDKVQSPVSVAPYDVKKFFIDIPTDSLPLINAEIEYQQIVKNVSFGEAAKKECKDKLDAYRKRIISGESDFGTLAVLYSADKGSARNNGELGFVNRGDLVPEFEAAAFKLQKNEISPVVETKFGFHIIQLIERRGNQINVRHILLRPTITDADNKQTIALLDSVVDLIHKDSISFSEAAQKYSDDEESHFSGGNVINPQTGTTRWEIDEIDRIVFQLIDQLNINEITAVVPHQTAQGKLAYRVIKLKERTKPHVLNMTDDYQRLQNLALTKNQEKALNDWVKKKKPGTFIQVNSPFNACSEFKIN
ncbi:MAG: peptidylprolyl isomerase [Bacteroidia bacterium]|nr:peptidylprolyl isomerase [Bacteroidia bacterium]